MKINKKRVLLIDAFSTLHVGNGALLQNTYDIVASNFEGEIDILSIDPGANVDQFENVNADFFRHYGGTRLKKLLFSVGVIWFFMIEFLNSILFKGKILFPWGAEKKNFLRLVNAADICISLSGETINDFYYSHMYLRVLTYWIAISRGKKFIFFPQSIGPIFRRASAALLRASLGQASYIVARDRRSFQLANTIWQGKKVEIVFCPDVAVLQDSELLRPNFLNKRKKVVGVTVSEFPRQEMRASGAYFEKIYQSIATVFDKNEYQIILMPSNYAYNKVSADYKVCQSAKSWFLSNGYEAFILENRLYYPDEYQGIQRSLAVFVTTRMHVGILATTAGIPTFMINTQHKILAYMENIGMSRFVGNLDDEMISWIATLRSLKENSSAISDELLQKNLKMREIVRNTVARIMNFHGK